MTSKAFELAQLGDAVTVNSDNVGIGTTNPIADFSLVDSSTGSGMEFQPELTTDTNRLTNYDRGDSAYKKFRLDASEQQFYIGGSEKAKLDSSGNLLVGKSSAAYNTDGFEARPNGETYVSRSGTPMAINRNSSDGVLLNFYKDGSGVGSISSRNGNHIVIASEGASGLNFGAYALNPWLNGSITDNTTDIGQGSHRFDDIYATNGTIQTSDEREKQNIAALTDAEITAAKAISKLFKTFKWKDKVVAKGDAARTHTGVIAQEVEVAMSDAGLDAGDYAFFISNTWWETSTEVAAVEADEENGIEAQDAYTSIETYNTADEAPEGATERNRKGIRYPELLSFIGAATEQRLTSIETRLDALEAE